MPPTWGQPHDWKETMARSVAVPPFDRTQGLAIAADLAAWYARSARVLPWRVGPQERDAGQRPDPYAVLISEIALQQTTVAVGKTRVPELLARFPTLESLAHAQVEEVLDAWAGLGYYARARNLHRAAREAYTRFGRIPIAESDLRTLPGVGAYTAAAVAAFAGDAPAVVVDGNVERVMARLHAIEAPLPKARPIIAAAAAAATPPVGAGNHAQAVMDLAALVCRPKSPACPECPVQHHCSAYAQGSPESFPRKAPKRPKPHRLGMCAVGIGPQGVVVERRPPTGLLGGTVGFPGGGWCEDAREAVFPAPADWISAGHVQHVFAHFSLDLEVWVGRLAPGVALPNRFFSIPLEEMEEARFSSLFTKAWDCARPVVFPT